MSAERLAAALTRVMSMHAQANSVEGMFDLANSVVDFDAALVERVTEIVKQSYANEAMTPDELLRYLEAAGEARKL